MSTENSKSGFVLWMTGLPCSGKTSLAHSLESVLKERHGAVEILDGDIVRTHLSKGLGFSREDRDTNILRIAFVAELLARNGVAVITATISPYEETRLNARKLITNFIETHIDTPLDVCINRDVKGMYKKALAGELKGFTGIDDPYEPPKNPEILVPTENQSLEESSGLILNKLVSLGFLK